MKNGDKFIIIEWIALGFQVISIFLFYYFNLEVFRTFSDAFFMLIIISVCFYLIDKWKEKKNE